MTDVARTNRGIVPLLVTTVFLLNGCTLLPSIPPGGGSPTPTPTPTAISIEEASTAWTGTICTFNVGARAFADTWRDDAASLRDLKEAAALAKTEAESAKEALAGTAWPAGLAEDVEVVVGYLEERIVKYDRVLSAEALEELDSIELASTPDDVNAAATRIEESLELGVDYCPQVEEPAPVDPVDAGAAELADSMWAGTDSDGDETEIFLAADGSAEVAVGDAVYQGSWELASGVLTIEVARTDNALAFNGFYEAGSAAVVLSGSATNGHTWTVELQRL